MKCFRSLCHCNNQLLQLIFVDSKCFNCFFFQFLYYFYCSTETGDKNKTATAPMLYGTIIVHSF